MENPRGVEVHLKASDTILPIILDPTQDRTGVSWVKTDGRISIQPKYKPRPFLCLIIRWPGFSPNRVWGCGSGLSSCCGGAECEQGFWKEAKEQTRRTATDSQWWIWKRWTPRDTIESFISRLAAAGRSSVRLTTPLGEKRRHRTSLI